MPGEKNFPVSSSIILLQQCCLHCEGQKAKGPGLHPSSMGSHGLTGHNIMFTFPAWQTLTPEGFPNFLCSLS